MSAAPVRTGWTAHDHRTESGETRTDRIERLWYAFSLVERPEMPASWVRCGTAIRDGETILLRLDVLPLTGQVYLRAGRELRQRDPLAPAPESDRRM